MAWRDHIPDDLSNLYEVHDFKHAAAILATEFQEEFQDVCTALRNFRFMEEYITMGRGIECNISEYFSNILRPMGWKKERLNAKMLIDDTIIRHDTPKIDYIKGRVAFDIEWIGKGQSFDRGLHAFRTFFDYDKMSLAILLTKSNDLAQYLNRLSHNTQRNKIKDKHVIINKHMKKLLTRLEAGINGGCPVLVFGITNNLLSRGA